MSDENMVYLHNVPVSAVDEIIQLRQQLAENNDLLEHLRDKLAAAEARGSCRILSGTCDCTLCKQDAKIAELTGKVGELETKLAAAQALLREALELRQRIGTDWESSLAGLAWIERAKEILR